MGLAELKLWDEGVGGELFLKKAIRINLSQ